MKPDWNAFVEWLSGYLEMPNIPIKWSRCADGGYKIVRIDICPDKPYQITTAVEDRSELCTDGVAYALARGLETWLSKAIENNRSYTYFRHFGIEARVW